MVGCLFIKVVYNGPATTGSNMCTSILLEQNSSESQVPSCPKMYVGKYKMRVISRNLSFSCIWICRVVTNGSPHNERVKNTSMVTPNLIASFNVLCSTFGEGCTTAGCVACWQPPGFSSCSAMSNSAFEVSGGDYCWLKKRMNLIARIEWGFNESDPHSPCYRMSSVDVVHCLNHWEAWGLKCSFFSALHT